MFLSSRWVAHELVLLNQLVAETVFFSEWGLLVSGVSQNKQAGENWGIIALVHCNRTSKSRRLSLLWRGTRWCQSQNWTPWPKGSIQTYKGA